MILLEKTSPFIAVGGSAQEPMNVAVVLEKTVIQEGFESFVHAVSYFLGVIYTPELQYSGGKNTYEFLQKGSARGRFHKALIQGFISEIAVNVNVNMNIEHIRMELIL